MDGVANRTWMWGPHANSPEMAEPYVEGTAGMRTVQYYDKSRMEISVDPDVDPQSVWYVTNGLLVIEMVSGRLQVGDGTFQDRAPAWINVAGDPEDPLGPTYATFGDAASTLLRLLRATRSPPPSIVTALSATTPTWPASERLLPIG